MKVDSVKLRPDGSTNEFELSFKDPRRLNPYNVKTIVGLDADDIVHRFYGRGESSNSLFYDLRPVKRELVIRVELNPDFSQGKDFSQLRDDLYRAISSSRTSLIYVDFVRTNAVVAGVKGFITKFESALFSRVPEVQITVQCHDSVLRSPNYHSVDLTGLDPALTTITDDISTAPHGVHFDLEVVTQTNTFKIYDPDNADWSLTVDMPSGQDFLVGDIIRLCSQYGHRYIYRDRAGAIRHLADHILPGSLWPVMFPGENNYAVENPTRFQWSAITYQHAFWGV